MKYPIKIQALIIERADSSENGTIAYRLRCKMEDGTPIIALCEQGPWPDDLPQDLRDKLDEQACSGVLHAAILKIRAVLETGIKSSCG